MSKLMKKMAVLVAMMFAFATVGAPLAEARGHGGARSAPRSHSMSAPRSHSTHSTRAPRSHSTRSNVKRSTPRKSTVKKSTPKKSTVKKSTNKTNKKVNKKNNKPNGLKNKPKMGPKGHHWKPNHRHHWGWSHGRLLGYVALFGGAWYAFSDDCDCWNPCEEPDTVECDECEAEEVVEDECETC